MTVEVQIQIGLGRLNMRWSLVQLANVETTSR